MTKPIIVKTPSEMISARRLLTEKSIGFVPSMGALHSGHAELLKRARAENEIVILSIFINPTQFNDQNDFTKYPKTLENDLILAAAENVDYIFTPNQEQMYPDHYRFRVTEDQFSKTLCGAHRPGHFDGVLSVVMKLFNIVKPNKAYFGEKDFQQLSLIQDMISAFFMDIQIIPVATIREVDGLAKSSRNTRLTETQRKLAPKIYELTSSLKNPEEIKMQLTNLGFEVDYVEDIEKRRFVAAKLGGVRLIDNVEI